MPAAYAHYYFGQKVRNNLNENIIKIITSNIDLFNIGLYGPDILFYYRPYIKNKVAILGSKIHSEKAEFFFKRAKDVIKHSKNPDASISYALGFICHFILDSRCHPYINEKVSKSGLTHAKIETEFEKVIINYDGEDYKTVNLTSPININNENSSIISSFFNLPQSKIKEALVSMKLFCSAFNKFYGSKRKILSAVLKIGKQPDDVIDNFFSEEDERSCKESNRRLHIILNSSVIPAVKTIDEFYNTLETSHMPSAFNKSFD